jgi:hypothetical protein
VNGDSIRQLADDIFREKVLRARKLSFAERFRAGGDLFDQMCAVSIAGIRQQNPKADEVQVRAIFAERMRIGRLLNDGNIYRVVEPELEMTGDVQQ